MQFDLAHLERGRVPVTHKIANQSPILAYLFCTAPIGHPRGLNYRGIVAHVINDPDEAMVKHPMLGLEDRLERGDGGTPGFAYARARRCDLGFWRSAGHSKSFTRCPGAALHHESAGCGSRKLGTYRKRR